MVSSDNGLAHLVERIYGHADLDSLAADLESGFIDAVDSSTLLYALRDAASGEMDRAWATTLVAACYQPKPFAISMHMQGRSLLIEDKYHYSVAPLLIACAAYRWSGDEDGFARAATTVAQSLYHLARFTEALHKVEAAADIFERSKKTMELCTALLTISSIYGDIQNPHKTLDAVYKTLNILQNALAHPFLTVEQQHEIYHQQFLAYIEQGRTYQGLLDQFTDASRAFENAINVLSNIDVYESHQWFVFWLNRAILELRLGRYTDATFLFNKAEVSLDHSNSTDDLEDRIDLHIYQLYLAILVDDLAKSRILLKSVWLHLRDRDTDQSFTPRERRQSAEVLLFAATNPDVLLGSIVETVDALIVQLEKAVERFRQDGLSLSEAAVRTTQANIWYRYVHDPSKARAALRQARGLLVEHHASRSLLETDVVYALNDADATAEFQREVAQQLGYFGDYPVQAQVLTTLGKQYETNNQTDDAYTAYYDAIDALNHVRTGLRLSNQSVQFLGRHRTPYERAFWLKREIDPITAWRWAEGVHAQTINDELVNHGLQSLAGNDPDTLVLLQQARQRVEYAQARASTVTIGGVHDLQEPHQAQHYERKAAEQAYIDLLDKLAAEGVDAARWIRGEIALHNEVQQLLDVHTALITFLRIEDINPSKLPELWVTILTNSAKPVCMAVLDDTQLRIFEGTWSKQWQVALDASVDEWCENEKATIVLEDMHAFVEPIFDALSPSITRLIIVPDERLPFIPFHALREDKGHYLIQRYTISYAPSATVLLNCTQRAEDRPRVRNSFVAGWDNRRTLKKLRNELESVSSLLETQAVIDALDSSETLHQVIQASVIHLGCHGEFPTDSHPRFARLRLNDESLYAHDIYTTRLQADLVTLSACDAGQHGPGLQGLVSALLVAGASSVVAALWPVIDEATPLFMKHFYTALKEGQDVSSALQTAQRALIRHEDYGHPSYWAPFFVTGLPTTQIT